MKATPIIRAVLLAAAAALILPLAPARGMGPFNALNPQAIWRLVVMILTISAAGQAATQAIGARLGAPLLGFFSGFVSSSATIGAMGGWARANPAAVSAAVAAAVLSTTANYLQTALILAVASPSAFWATLAPVASAGLAALACGGAFVLTAWRVAPSEPPRFDRGFSLVAAVGFAALVAALTIAVAAMRAAFGEAGMTLAAALGGVLDVHAAAISIAGEVRDGVAAPSDAVLPLLTACTTSTLAKTIFAAASGPRDFAQRVIAAQVLILAVAWIAGLAALRLA